MNTTDLGRIGEAKVIARLTELGWYPFVDVSGKCSIDLIALRNGEIRRIQVKSCQSSNNGGTWQIQLKSVRPNRTGNVIKFLDITQVDCIAIYLHDIDAVVFVRTSDMDVISTINFRETQSKFTKSSRLVKDYQDLL